MKTNIRKFDKIMFYIATFVGVASIVYFAVGFTVTSIEVSRIPDTSENQTWRGMASIGYATAYVSSGLIGFPAALYVTWFAHRYLAKGVAKKLSYLLVGAIAAMIAGPILYILIDSLVYFL